MNEELQKSKKLEEQIRAESQTTEHKETFSSYTQVERHDALNALQQASRAVQYEDMLAHGYKGEMPLESYDNEQREHVHRQAEAADAGLSWSQKRKVRKQQMKDREQAQSAGVQNATALTVSLSLARAQGQFEADEHMDKLTPDEFGELSRQRPDEALFDRHFREKDSNPYDVTKMSCRLAELKRVAANYTEYKNNVAAGSVPQDLDYECRCESQAQIQRSLSRAMDALFHANAIPLRETLLTEEELAGDRTALKNQCIKQYEHDAANYDALVTETSKAIFNRNISKELAKTPVNEQDEKELGFSFRQRPAELDELRRLIDAPENSQNVEKNAPVIRKVLGEYIRAQHTLDERRTGVTLLDRAGENFQTLRDSEKSDVFHLEGLVSSYATILRSLTTGAPMDTFSDFMLAKQFNIYTPQRIEAESKYDGVNVDKSSLVIRKQFEDNQQQLANSISKYFGSLPPEQVNKRMDSRIVLGLCKGWKTDSDGNPLTEDDRKTMERETKWVHDLYGKTDDTPRTDKTEEAARLEKNQQIEQARHAVIDQYIDRYVGLKLDEKMLTTDYIRAHYAELTEMTQIMLLLDNFQAGDPDYFKTLPKERQIMLDAAAKSYFSVTPYLKYTMSVTTGLEENGHFSSPEALGNYKATADMLQPQAKEAIKYHNARMHEIHFDLTTDNFSAAEGGSFTELFGSMSPEHFADKLKSRTKKGLPCNELGEFCEFMHGQTLADYYEAKLHPQYAAEDLARMRDQGFGGASVHFDDLEFGTDDLGTVYETIKVIANGGADAAAYGADEETSARVAVLFERFRDESLENAKLKALVSNMEEFLNPLDKAVRSMADIQKDYPTLYASIRQYAQLGKASSDDFCDKVLESDHKLRAGVYLDIIGLLGEKNISFRADQRAALADYMNDPAQVPEIDVQRAVDLNGQQLQVNGMEAGDLVTERRIAKKREQLGEGFPAWSEQLAAKVAEANAAYATGRKYHSVAESYFVKAHAKYTANGDMMDAEKKCKEKNLSEEELARRQADYEEKKKAYDAIDPKAGNPVFSKIGSKSHFMQYELMQKEEACEKQYNAVVTEIRDMMK